MADRGSVPGRQRRAVTSRRRLRSVVLVAVIAGALGWAASRALVGNLVYYVTPTELRAHPPAADERVRLGAFVVPGSLVARGAAVSFVVTDGTTRTTVIHDGPAPALFRAGIGVVLEGLYGSDGVFRSDTMLIKHSEDYRPPGRSSPAARL